MVRILARIYKHRRKNLYYSAAQGHKLNGKSGRIQDGKNQARYLDEKLSSNNKNLSHGKSVAIYHTGKIKSSVTEKLHTKHTRKISRTHATDKWYYVISRRDKGTEHSPPSMTYLLSYSSVYF